MPTRSRDQKAPRPCRSHAKMCRPSPGRRRAAWAVVGEGGNGEPPWLTPQTRPALVLGGGGSSSNRSSGSCRPWATLDAATRAGLWALIEGCRPLADPGYQWVISPSPHETKTRGGSLDSKRIRSGRTERHRTTSTSEPRWRLSTVIGFCPGAVGIGDAARRRRCRRRTDRPLERRPSGVAAIGRHTDRRFLSSWGVRCGHDRTCSRGDRSPTQSGVVTRATSTSPSMANLSCAW
jgi:hypothetical protein